MKNPVRLLLAALAILVFNPASAQTPAPAKPGYSVTVEVEYNEEGVPMDGAVVKSDDPTGDHSLEQVALDMARQDKQQPRLVDGKPVKFKARRPFNFPVEGDQGEAANADRPVLRSGHQPLPVYPEALAAQDVMGGAIVEITIRADGTVREVRTLRASHPEFAAAAETAIRQWVFLPREGPGRPVESNWRMAIAFSTQGRNVDLKWRVAPRPSIGGFIVGRLPTTPPAATTAPQLTAPAPEAPVEKK
jgi:TonB family protein